MVKIYNNIKLLFITINDIINYINEVIFMTDYNELLKKLLDNYSLTEITEKKVKEVFPSFEISDKENDKYSLLHIIADNEHNYNVDKIIKVTSIIINSRETKLNYNNIYGAYSFIHLAFYSNYPLNFFEKIIPLAIQNGFDINSKDDDGDTILHTAIYSEDYLDSIFSIFSLVGDSFDFCAVNKENKNIVDALEDSIKEAKKNNNTNWLEKLEKEKTEITEFVNNKIKIKQEELEQKKREEQIKLEQKKYNIFLANFNEKLENYDSLQTVNNLLEQSEKIQDIEYKLAVTKNIRDIITKTTPIYAELKEELNKLDHFNVLDKNNPTLSSIKKTLETYTIIESIPIYIVKELIMQIKQSIDNSCNILIERTMEEINQKIEFLIQLQQFTEKDLINDTKKLVLSKKEKSNE